MVYVISRQTQYIVINSNDSVPSSGPTAQTIEVQPWWEYTSHSGSSAETLQEVKPVCADQAQQMPCSRAELPPTRHESGAADKDNTETTSCSTSSKSSVKAAKKKELAKTRRKIKRRRARKREAELINFKELVPFSDLTGIARKSPNPQLVTETTGGSLFGSTEAKERLDSGSLVGKAAFNGQSMEESEPNSADAYPAHPALVLTQYSKGIMSQFGNFSDSDEEGEYELDDTITCMMKTEKWKAAHRMLCENLIQIGLSAVDAGGEALDELIELVYNTIPGQEVTEDEFNKRSQNRINSYLPLGRDITGYQVFRQTTQGSRPVSSASQTPLPISASQIAPSGQLPRMSRQPRNSGGRQHRQQGKREALDKAHWVRVTQRTKSWVRPKEQKTSS